MPFPKAFEEGMSLTVVLEFDAADGYAFGPIGGLPRTRILINGVPAELTMSDYLPPYEAPMSVTASLSFTVAQPGGTLYLPSSLRVIEKEALSGTDAWRIIIPEGTTTIGARAFAGCHSLERVVIPESVTSIADDAFEGCPKKLMIVTDNAAVENFADARDIIVFHDLAG